MAFFGVVGMGYDAMIAAYLWNQLSETGVEGYSTLLAFSGVGATAGALVIATLSGVRRKERLTIAGLVLFSGFLALAADLADYCGTKLDQRGPVIGVFLLSVRRSDSARSSSTHRR